MCLRLRLGFSPCPNDTFIMYGIFEKRLLYGHEFEFHIEDVESLNQKVLRGVLDISKVSYGVLPYISKDYEVLSAGSAMGFGCGPLLISKKGLGLEALKDSRIGSPGRYTTARALLEIYGGKGLNILDTTYEKIIPGVLDGTFDMGLLIHESRFTIERYELDQLLDLGQWWEQSFGLPIPLGGFVCRKALRMRQELESLLKDSLSYAQKNFNEACEFARLYAQEVDEEIVRRHISLYVTSYTYDMGVVGKRAVEAFIQKMKVNMVT